MGSTTFLAHRDEQLVTQNYLHILCWGGRGKEKKTKYVKQILELRADIDKKKDRSKSVQPPSNMQEYGRKIQETKISVYVNV